MRQKSLLPVILSLLFVDMVCQSLAFPSMPSLIAELSGTNIQDSTRLYGLLAAAYAVADLFGAPILGMLSDRIGRRPLLILSCFSTVGSYLLTALAPTLEILFVGYALAGLTSSLMVVTQVTIADVTAPKDRVKAYSYMGAVFGIGFVIGPALGGFVATYGLRTPFFLAAGIMGVAAVVVTALMPETHPVEKRTKTFSWTKLSPWTALAVLGRYPLLRNLAWTVMLNALALNMLVATWVPYCTYRYGFGVAENGYLLSAFGVSVGIAQATVVPWLAPKIGLKNGLIVGLVVSIISYIGYGLAATWIILLAVTMAGSFGALDEPSLQAIIANEADDSERGTVQGGLATIGSLMGIVGPPIGTLLFALFTGPQAPTHLPGVAFFAGAICVTIGLALAIGTLKRFPLKPTEASPVPVD
jgi:DHA1 family tetracycline resistance protein-like MFS transporter